MIKNLKKYARIAAASLCMLLAKNTEGNSIEDHSDLHSEVGVDYSRTGVSSGSDETKVLIDRVGAYIKLPFLYYMRGLVGAGGKRIDFEYFNDVYKGIIEDLNVRLDTGLAPYLIIGIDFGIPFRNFGFGGFIHSEHSTNHDVNVDRLEGRIGTETFSVDSVDYSSHLNDVGFAWSFVHGRLRLDAIFAYADMDVRFAAKYTEAMMDQMERLGLTNAEIVDGNFNHNLSGLYVRLRPSLRFGRWLVGLDGGFMRVDGSRAYTVGSSVGILDFQR